MPPLSLRQTIAVRPLIGTFLKLPRRETVEVLALAGFDFLICDMEHAQIGEEEARLTILAGIAAGIPVMVRVAELQRGLVNRLLEAGAAGIQVPRVRRRSDAAALSDLTHYPPAGSRSISLAQPGARYGGMPVAEYIPLENQRPVLAGQLETADLEEPLEDVLEPLDVAFIGSLDLTVDLGLPGQITAAPVQARIAAIEAAARRSGTALGIFAATPDDAQRALAAGYRYVAVGADLSLLRAGAQGLMERLRAEGAPGR